MQFHELGKYQKGKSPEGDDLFSITLPTDEDGMTGRECPDEDCQPRYFKIDSDAELPDEDTSDDEGTSHNIFCPYCGLQKDIQEFNTQAQVDWMMSLLERDVHRMVDDIFNDTFNRRRSPSSKGLISIELSYKSGPLPSVRHYAEEQLKNIVECDNCSSKYAVYGLSFFCPFCSKGNLLLHLKRNIQTIKSFLGAKEQIKKIGGKDATHHLLGNCLEDCVSLFEGFLKTIYSFSLKKIVSEEVRDKKLSALRNSFQNLSKAERILSADLNWSLFDGIESTDKEFFELQFAKRHVITHNLGLIDKKFLEQVKQIQREGREVDIEHEDIENLLGILENLLSAIIKKFDATINA